MTSKASYYRKLKKEIGITLSSAEMPLNYGVSPVNSMPMECSASSNDYGSSNPNIDGTSASPPSPLVEMESEYTNGSNKSVSFHSSDDTFESNINVEHQNVTESLREWAIETKASHTSINLLLEKLKVYHPELPRDSRTLLRNKVRTDLISLKLENGEMIYYGLENVLKQELVKGDYPENVSLTINLDGIPIAKSTNAQFWPVLGKLDCSNEPFLIGLFYGNGKPTPLDEYLEPLVNDLLLLKGNSKIDIDGKPTYVTLKGIICDAVGRAFIKGTAAHNSKYGCEKCKVKGEYHERTMCFLDENAECRSNNDFLAFQVSENSETTSEDEDLLDDCIKLHIKRSSPLIGIVNLVDEFPLEFMHLVCLGVTKRLLRFLTKKVPSKLSSRSLSEINRRLDIVSDQFPSDFARKPRSLEFADRFKATECRMFLLYTGPIVLKDILSRKSYEHFLLLHFSIKQLTQPQLLTSDELRFVQECLLSFIRHSKALYGKVFVSYNVHSICHLVEDYKRFGPLDNFSAFCFESYLGSLKRMLRSHNRPLSQMKKRIEENLSVVNRLSPVDEHLGSYNKENNCYHSCSLKAVKLRSKSRDNGFFDIHGNMFVFEYARKFENKLILYGKMLEKYDDFYTYPSASRNNGIVVIKSFSEDIHAVDSKLIAGKCAIISVDRLRICCKVNTA